MKSFLYLCDALTPWKEIAPRSGQFGEGSTFSLSISSGLTWVSKSFTRAIDPRDISNCVQPEISAERLLLKASFDYQLAMHRIRLHGKWITMRAGLT